MLNFNFCESNILVQVVFLSMKQLMFLWTEKKLMSSAMRMGPDWWRYTTKISWIFLLHILVSSFLIDLDMCSCLQSTANNFEGKWWHCFRRGEHRRRSPQLFPGRNRQWSREWLDLGNSQLIQSCGTMVNLTRMFATTACSWVELTSMVWLMSHVAATPTSFHSVKSCGNR